MRLEKLVLSVTAFAVSTVFAGDSLLNFDKTDPTATCILTAESPSPKYVLILFPGGDGRVAAHQTGGNFVHHVSDACKSTPYDAARELAAKLNADFMTVSGGKTKGKPCQAFAYHGFNGLEEKVVDEIKNWIKARAQ